MDRTGSKNQLYGCYWHGFPRCYPNRNEIHPHKQKPMEEIYRETLEIEYKLKSMDKQDFRCIWEHESDEQESQDAYAHIPMS